MNYLSFAKTSHANEALVVINRHNSRNNGASNSNLATIIHKFEVNVSVIKQLCDDYICSGIHLNTII